MDLDLNRKQKLQIVSFGFGTVTIATAIILYTQTDMEPIAASLFVAGIVIATLPYALYIYFRDRRYNQMEKEFPSFLRNLSEGIKSGMSLPEAFQQASRTDYGQLDTEVRRASHQLSWGIPFSEVMERMAGRMEGSELIRRSIYIVLQSYESGGNISETLDAIASNASMIKEAEKEKKSVLQQQVYIIYAIHFLFLGIIVALYVLLSGFILQMGDTGGGGAAAGGLGFGSIDNFCTGGSIAQPLCTLCPTFDIGTATDRICYYKSLFLIMLVVEGVMNGLVAGEVMEGKLSAGVKHSLLMSVLGLFLYIVALNVV